MVVLDQHDLRERGEHMPQLGGALAIERSATRILRARRHDKGFCAKFERAIQIGGQRPRFVNRNRLRHQRQRRNQVEHAGVARIFDGDDVAGPQMGLQDALDGVERAADDRNRVGRDPVALELPRRQLDQRRTILRIAVLAGNSIEPREIRLERRQHRRVRPSIREIAQARRRRRKDRTRQQRRPPIDDRPATPRTMHQAAHPQRIERSRDGSRTDTQARRQCAHGRQTLTGAQLAAPDSIFDAGGDLVA